MISYPNSILASHTNDPTSLYANATPSSCSIATNHSSSLPRKHSKMSLTFLNNPTSAHFNHHVDTFASPSSSPQTDHSDPIQSVIYTSPATFSDHAAIHESQSSADCDSEDDPDNSPNFKARKRAFIKSLTEQRADKGYLTCKLCMQSIWGPNGTICSSVRYTTNFSHPVLYLFSLLPRMFELTVILRAQAATILRLAQY